MKIAMMTNNYKPFIGGVPISVERLSQSLRKRGHEVCIFAPEYEDEYWEEDVIRYRSCEKRMKNGMAIPNILDARINQEFRWREFDLIHVHQPMLIGNVAVHLSRKYKIPLVYTYHTRYEEYLHYIKLFSEESGQEAIKGHILRQGKKMLPYYMANYMKRCDMVIAPSRGMADYLRGQKIKTPVRVLPTGLAEESFEEDKEQAEAIRKRYLGGGEHLLCTVSRLDKEKNLYFLMRCMYQLKSQTEGNVRLVVVGDGAERAGIAAYVKELGIEDVVSFIGQIPNDEVRNYLQACDAFVFASKSETQGIVLAEAMASGLPVAAISACGVDDIVSDGCNGYLAKEDEKEFASCVAGMLSDPDNMARLKIEAKKKAENYRMSYIAARAEENYRMVIERREEKYGYGESQIYEKGHTVSSFLRLFKVS